VTNVELLQTVKEKAIDSITITLVSDLLDTKLVAELGELIDENPGNTKLFFQLRDSSGKKHVLLRSGNKKVDVRHTLIDFIDSQESMDYKIN
jgi:DNA polymerase-3 subunit alpha